MPSCMTREQISNCRGQLAGCPWAPHQHPAAGEYQTSLCRTLGTNLRSENNLPLKLKLPLGGDDHLCEDDQNTDG